MKNLLKGQYITNLSLDQKSGGWSGMNINIHKQLTHSFEISYSSPINPPVFKSEQIASKLKAIINQKRNFEYFSEKRLSVIADQFNKQLKSDTDFLFFHGTTPWIKCHTHLPYYAYVDATFFTYLDIYLNPEKFCPQEISRIVSHETEFLTNASGIFFSSEWARQETIHRYHLNGHNFHTVSLGGNSSIGTLNIEKGAKNLLFVSMDFKRKGGHIAYEAFRQLTKSIEGLTLHIIGDKPPLSIINSPGVCYHGFIDKSTEAGRKKFQDIFNEAAFLIHPTEKDMTPLIIVEAGYNGIPTIAPKRFGIPEMIKNNETGFIVKKNTVNEYVEVLSNVLSNTDALHNLRKKCFEFITYNYNWNRVGQQISHHINSTINI